MCSENLFYLLQCQFQFSTEPKWQTSNGQYFLNFTATYLKLKSIDRKCSKDLKNVQFFFKLNHGECYNVLKIVFWDTLYIFYLILISHVYTSGVHIVTPAIYPHLNKFTGKLQFCYLSQLFQLRISKPLPTNKLIDRQTEITTLYIYR